MNSTEQTTALTLIQQHLMHRRSPSGAYQYEQLTVYFDNATGDYVSHWYTGRSRHTMERRAEASYALESLMETRVANFVSQGEADGFEYVDRIVETFADVPFSRFLGARLAPLSLSTLKSSPGWLDPNNTVLVPYVSRSEERRVGQWCSCLHPDRHAGCFLPAMYERPRRYRHTDSPAAKISQKHDPLDRI